MRQSLISDSFYMRIEKGKLAISLSANVGPQGNQRYCTFLNLELSPAPGAMCLAPKDVEFLCSKLAEGINAIWKEEAKQRQDKESCPALLLSKDASDLERWVAGLIMEAEDV